jgi:MFS family permease
MKPTQASGHADDMRAPLGAWYMLSLLFFVYMFSAVDRMVIGLIVEPIKETFKVDDAFIGLLSGVAYSAPFALASLPMGLLVDRTNRVKLLAAIVAVWSVTTAICAMATSSTALLVTRMAVGASEAGAIPAALSLLSDTFPAKRRGAAVGVFYSAASLAQVIVFLGGALILTQYSWHAVFLIAGLPGLIIAALLFFASKEPPRGRFDSQTVGAVEKTKLLDTLRLVAADGPIRCTVLGNMIATGVGGAIGFWAVSFFVRVHSLPSHQAATVVGLCLGLVGFLGALVTGPIIDRIAKGDASRISYFPAAAAAGAAIAGLVMANAPTLPLVIAGYASMCFCIGGFLGPGNLLLLSVTPAKIRGSVVSVNKLVSILIGSSVFSFMAGKVSDLVGGQGGIRIGLMTTFMFFFVAALLFFLAGHSIRSAASRDRQADLPKGG